MNSYLSYNILIVEDEIFIADYIETLLKASGFEKIHKAHNKRDAQHLLCHLQPEIVLMDINIEGDMDGIKLAQELPSSCILIYITGQNDMGVMSNALATKPYSYLTKPIKRMDLIAAIELAKQLQPKTVFELKDGHIKICLRTDDILYVKSDNNYIDIVLKDRKYTLRQSIKQFLKEINSKDFTQVHRSYVVNIKAVSKKSSHSVFIDNIEIPISRNVDL